MERAQCPDVDWGTVAPELGPGGLNRPLALGAPLSNEGLERDRTLRLLQLARDNGRDGRVLRGRARCGAVRWLDAPSMS